MRRPVSIKTEQLQVSDRHMPLRVRNRRHQYLENKKDDERGKIKAHGPDANRRKKVADGSHHRLGDPKQHETNCLQNSRAVRWEPTEHDSPEESEKEDLKDKVNE